MLAGQTANQSFSELVLTLISDTFCTQSLSAKLVKVLLFVLFIFVCVYACTHAHTRACATQQESVGQSTTCGSWRCSPSTMWSGEWTEVVRLDIWCPYPLGNSTSLKVFLLTTTNLTTVFAICILFYSSGFLRIIIFVFSAQVCGYFLWREGGLLLWTILLYKMIFWYLLCTDPWRPPPQKKNKDTESCM